MMASTTFAQTRIKEDFPVQQKRKVIQLLEAAKARIAEQTAQLQATQLENQYAR